MLGLWIPFAFALLFKQDRSEERPDLRHHIPERWSLCACAALVLFPTGRQQLVLRKGIGENGRNPQCRCAARSKTSSEGFSEHRGGKRFPPEDHVQVVDIFHAGGVDPDLDQRSELLGHDRFERIDRHPDGLWDQQLWKRQLHRGGRDDIAKQHVYRNPDPRRAEGGDEGDVDSRIFEGVVNYAHLNLVRVEDEPISKVDAAEFSHHPPDGLWRIGQASGGEINVFCGAGGIAVASEQAQRPFEHELLGVSAGVQSNRPSRPCWAYNRSINALGRLGYLDAKFRNFARMLTPSVVLVMTQHLQIPPHRGRNADYVCRFEQAPGSPLR